MVTLITDKLQQQTLEEISSMTKTLQSEQLRTASKEKEGFDISRKSTKSSHQHRRSHTTRNIKIESIRQDGPEQSRTLPSFTTARCNSYPPAKKRICRSLSDPYKERDTKSVWNPEPSSIWTPVKPSKRDRSRSTGTRSLEFTNRDTFNWSTPPESPIPRPVSANSALEDSNFFPLRFISEESDNRGSLGLCLGRQPRECSSSCSAMPRSHSHPSFSNIVNNGLKRRLSEVDIPRPALDFDKMKARSFANTSIPKRTVKSPKYWGKRYASVSPKTPNVPTNKTTLSPVSVDLSSSLMITPTASPTDMPDVKIAENEKCVKQDENANPKAGSLAHHHCFSYALKIDTDLDIKLIEEDGTKSDSEIHSIFFN